MAAGARHAASSCFGFGSEADQDYYPTTGFFTSDHTGNSPVLTSSDLRTTAQVSIDALIVLANTDGATWTLKDAAGTTLATYAIAATTPGGTVIPIGLRIPFLGGFTMRTDDIATPGLCLYTPLVPAL